MAIDEQKEQQLNKEREALTNLYKQRGFQQQSFKNFKALRRQEQTRKKFKVKYYRGDIFWTWCRDVCRSGTGHGSYLVKLLGSPHPPQYNYGMTDNVRAAQEFLRHARSVGWILRDRLHPSMEQQFFGIGGSRYKYAEGKYLVDFVWKPNRESKSFQAFVETGVVGRLKTLSERYILKLEGME